MPDGGAPPSPPGPPGPPLGKVTPFSERHCVYAAKPSAPDVSDGVASDDEPHAVSRSSAATADVAASAARRARDAAAVGRT
jgi:hypothetical protein